MSRVSGSFTYANISFKSQNFQMNSLILMIWVQLFHLARGIGINKVFRPIIIGVSGTNI